VFQKWITRLIPETVADMNLSSPLSAFSPPTMARALEVLAGTTRPLTGREIHRIAGQGGVASMWRTLGRLTEQGIVSADHRGTAIYYAANRDHLAWPAIEVLVRIRAQLIARLAKTISAWAIQPLHASLFGSTARGDGDAHSDIDLLLVRPDGLSQDDENALEEQVSEMRRAVIRWTGNNCQTFQVDRTRLLEHVTARDPLVDAWVRDGVELAGMPLADLTGDLRRLPVP
jgi:predicted nucleotidyltransferase